MGLQMGICYRTGEPVSDLQATMIQQSLVQADHSSPEIWCSGHVCLAYTDLAIGRAPNYVQPYVSRNAAITFDGRLDNREDLSLLLHDVLGREQCDPALALAAYQRHGNEGLAKLVGDWSLALWDGERQELILASDFAGVRPLYYSVDSTRIAWSTQLKRLLDWVRPSGIDDDYVAAFLKHGGYPGRTPYRNVFTLRPGHCLVVSHNGIQLRRFWELPASSVIRYSCERDYEERLRELFRDAVRCRLRSEVPVLSELSGGLDSSSIVCMARHLIDSGEASVRRVVTLSYEHEGSLDRRFYTAVERACGFESFHLRTDDYRVLTETDTGDGLPNFWDQLHTGVAQVAQGLGVRTLLTGTFGDLIMGNWWNDSSQISGLIRKGAITEALRQSLAWSKALRLPAVEILWNGILSSLPAPMVKARSKLFSDGPQVSDSRNDSLTSSFRARTGFGEGYSAFSQVWMEARPERRKHFRAVSETLELRKLESPEPLVHLNYTHPFAHRPLVDYMLSIPPEIVCQPGEPRRLMRRAFRAFWPPELQKRKSKDSFGGVFLEALRPLIPKLLGNIESLEIVERGYVDPQHLKERLERLAHSLECNTSQLRRLMLLEFWLRRSKI